MGIVYRPTSSGIADFGQEAGGLYSVRNLMYPENLENSPEFGGHKVVFFINVPGNSKLATGNDESSQYGTMNMPSGANRYYVPVGTASRDVTSRTVNSVSNAASRLNDWASPLTAPVGNAASSVGTAARDALGLNPTVEDTGENRLFATFVQQPKRLTAAIVLHMPNALINSYNVNWSEEDLFVGSALETVATGTSNAVARTFESGTGENVLQRAGAGGSAMVSNAVVPGVAAAAAVVLKRMSYAQRNTMITPGDSKMEQLFKNVDFRNFTFDYQFSPKTASEARSVLNIVRMFRHHMLPEYFDENNFLYVYPSEFEIRYYMRDKENDKLERQITAVLMNMVVNHAPNGVFTTFPDGTPTQINVTLNFRELSVPTKETSPPDMTGV